jgi:selenide, water dikinase
MSTVRLTQTVKKGGCAAKIAAGTLRNLLQTLPKQTHPNLLIGTTYLDDAAVWQIHETQVAIQTLDFFTPILDDPYDFGAVAAANALSDVFAMGARPSTALTILAYPLETLPDDILQALMAGAIEKINEAGAFLVGGHSIDDETLKLGFSVTGFSHPDKLWSNQTAQVGDKLILTKALGTGTLTGAVKNDELNYQDIHEAIASMKALNDLKLQQTRLHQSIHAATDVTGFGLLGHALHIAQGSNISLQIQASAIPLLEHAQQTLEKNILTKAHKSNTLYVQDKVLGRNSLNAGQWWSLVDPQTSGGLLLSVDAKHAEACLEHIQQRFPRASFIGEVVAKQDYPLLVQN